MKKYASFGLLRFRGGRSLGFGVSTMVSVFPIWLFVVLGLPGCGGAGTTEKQDPPTSASNDHAPAAPTEKEQLLVVVEGQGLRLRAAPNTVVNNVVMSLNKGAELTFLSQVGEKPEDRWYEVSYQGKTGWVSAEFCSLREGPGTSAKGIDMVFVEYSEGDYPHFIFREAVSKEEHDFGYIGDNHLGSSKILLEDPEAGFGLRANPQYLNKHFRVIYVEKPVIDADLDGKPVDAMGEVIDRIVEMR